MGFNGKHTFRLKRLITSHRHALNGIRFAFQEPNFRFHTAAAIAVITAGALLSLTATEWLIIFILVFGMLVLEMVNTAIEKTVDLVTEDFHPLAKQAKDLAAGAVLVFAILSAVTGSIIFLPKLAALLSVF
nr:diacylglycerol kinase family protein [Bacillus xiapuensis]